MNRQPQGIQPFGCFGSGNSYLTYAGVVPLNREMRRYQARKKEKASGNWPFPQPTEPQRKEGSQ
jgi:hypothetical protein